MATAPDPTTAPSRRSLWRRRCIVLAVLVCGWFTAGTVAAWRATSPWPAPIAPRAEIGGVPVVDVEARAADGITVRGWLCTADPTRCVVLAPGIRANRGAMVDRAAWWLGQRWSTLLVDLRGTGQSDPTPISLGWHEANDLVAWRELLAARGFTRIGAHGQSLGAAAVVYSTARGAEWAFVVLEACYDDIRHAVANRMPWVPLPGLVLWPMVTAAELRLGIDAEELRPIAFVPRLTMPAWLLAGDADPSAKLAEAEAMLRAFGSPHKRLVLIPGPRHVDLWSHDTAACTQALVELLHIL